MPKFGFTQEDGQIVRWLKREGDLVEQGEPIVEVTTDKVNMEVEAPESGVLTGVRAQEGDTVPVTQVIAFVAPTNLSTSQPANRATVNATPVAQRIAREHDIDLSGVHGTGAGGRVTRADVESQLVTVAPAPQPSPPGGEGDRTRATPNARRLADELGIDLAGVHGSGPRGRVQSSDVLEAMRVSKGAEEQKGRGEHSPSAPPPRRTIPYAGMRKTIGARLQHSYQQAPHVTFDVDVDVTRAEALRARANAMTESKRDDRVKVSLTAVIVKAAAWALRRHPLLNSRLDLEANHIVLNDEVHVGVAVALDDGLIVPVVRHAERKSVTDIARAIADLTARAKANTLRPDDLGGTFTISNLGMFGVDRFTAIINPPESAILAVGRVVRRFVPDANDQPVARPLMTLTLSADHRVVDGAVAARFLADLRDAIESPDSMLL